MELPVLPFAGIPAPLFPFHVLSPVMREAVNDTPFGGLVGTDPYTSSIVLRIKPVGEGFVHRWAATADMDPNKVAFDTEPYSTAVESKQYAQNECSISKIKWENLERFTDLQRIGTPLEDETNLLLGLARRKYAQRFVIEVIKSITSGAKGIKGRYDYTVNGSMPVVGRCFYGTTNAGDYTAYTVNNGATFPAQIHATIGGTEANLSVKIIRKLSDIAMSRTPQPALHPCRILKGDGMFSERRQYYLFVTLESAEQLYADPDFKREQLERGVDLARQANPMQADRIAAVVGDITVIKTPELKDLAAMGQAALDPAGAYHHNLLFACDALRMVQSSQSDGLQIMMNKGSFQAEEDEAVKILYSYMKGYKCPAYFNKATGGYAGDGVTASTALAESGIIHLITKVA